MKKILTRIVNGEVLSREETRLIIHNIVDGQYNTVQISSLLTGLIMRGIKVDELLGLCDGLIETGQPVDFAPHKVIDIVGTGGDEKTHSTSPPVPASLWREPAITLPSTATMQPLPPPAQAMSWNSTA